MSEGACSSEACLLVFEDTREKRRWRRGKGNCFFDSQSRGPYQSCCSHCVKVGVFQVGTDKEQPRGWRRDGRAHTGDR